MFYELRHPLSADYFMHSSGADFSFQSHLHHCFELVWVTAGEMHTDVDDRSYDLRAGDALLIFPNQIHAMQTPEHSEHTLCLFSPKLVSAFTEKTASRVPSDNLFRPDPFYLEAVKAFPERPPLIPLKGFLYTVCGCFDEGATYREAAVRSNTLLYTIFRFIEENYSHGCTLYDLSKHTGYDYAYLSRYFKKSVGISYNDYVNQYRISEACYLLQNSEMTVLEISDECGFNSLRSLNRHFKEQLSIPPAEYRRQYRIQSI